MSGHTIILRGPDQRALAKRVIDLAPQDAVVTIRKATRSKEQNDRMWAMLTDVAKAQPDGRAMTPDMWKAAFMNALGHQVMFLDGLDGQPFPYGFRSSQLTKVQMSDLMEFMSAWGSERGVRWSEPARQY